MKILYVEDNPDDIDLLRRELEQSIEELTFETAPTLKLAKEKIDNMNDLNILLIDIKLPNGNGLDLLSYIRRSNIPLPVIVLTGFGDEEGAVLSIKAGADEYISKKTGFYAKVPDAITRAIIHYENASKKKEVDIKVLYIERNKEDVIITQRHINRYAPHIQIDFNDRPEDFLKDVILSENKLVNYDVILLDYRLPNLNAVEIVKAISSSRQSELPIIVVTGQGDEEIAGQLLQLGATDYIVKNTGYLFKLQIAIQSAYEKVKLLKQQQELKRKNEELAEVLDEVAKSEEKYRLLITKMEQGLALHQILLDQEGKPVDYLFVDVNESFEKVTGLKRENIIGKTVREVLPETEDYWIETYGNVALSGESIHYENYSKEIGKYFEVVAYSPQALHFAVIISDITDRKRDEERILYLGYHDQLTGLYNRKFYEEELQRLDMSGNLPFTIAMGDVNGLKLINDSFGNVAGDEMLKMASEIIKKGCRANDIIARMGGDEFGIIFPGTDEIEAETIIDLIKNMPIDEDNNTIGVSISFGHETKKIAEEKIEDIIKKTEDHMYRHKLYESSSMRSKTIDMIMNTLYEKNHREMLHSKRVGNLCEEIATQMNFTKDDINQLRLAGLMHDIGKIGIDEKILNKPTRLDQEEWEEIKRHSEIGYRILSSVNEFSEISEYVLQHQEKWDGTGYPKGLKREEISISARIISIADAYDAMTSLRAYGTTLSEKEAIAELEKCAGSQFDPDLVATFISTVLKSS